VSLNTALNRITTYQIQNLTTGDEQRVNTSPDGTQTQLHIGTDGSGKATLTDGTVINFLPGHDKRFGILPFLAKSLSITTRGSTSTVTIDRTASVADPLNPLTLTAQIDKITVNSRSFTSSFDATSKTCFQYDIAGRVRGSCLPDGRRLWLRCQGQSDFPDPAGAASSRPQLHCP
jgi:hypothetical protein